MKQESTSHFIATVFMADGNLALFSSTRPLILPSVLAMYDTYRSLSHDSLIINFSFFFAPKIF
jgi:hypothetical protein